MKKSSKSFFERNFWKQSTVTVAQKLLGTFLVHNSSEGRTVGRIVETEAYLSDDPACHAARGETPRNRVMFGPPGHAYIYFIYGMYHCFNVVTAPLGKGEAVLIRSLEPVEGLELMQKRRLSHRQRQNQHIPEKELCNGPGKLVIAMGMHRSLNGIYLMKGPLSLYFSKETPSFKIKTTTRIGIREGADLPLRFYIQGNPSVSKK